ncbi:MAG: response regulator [Candidatus Woesearchaeota archaeon]
MTTDIKKPYSILVVDDEQSIVKLLVKTLSLQGYQTEGVTSGHDALKVFSQRSFDAVISDLYMPKMNGRDLFIELRKKKEDIPVIIMTASPELEDAKWFKERKLNAFVAKPFKSICSIDDVLQRIFSVKNPLKEYREEKNLLIIDDDKKLCNLLCELFKNDFKVFVASEPEIAYNIMRCNKISIVLLDKILGEYDGRGMLLRLRYNYPFLRIVLHTGFPESSDTELLYAPNELVHAIAVKPMSYEEYKALLCNEYKKRQEHIEEYIAKIKPQIIFIVGVRGAGKDTICDLISSMMPSAHKACLHTTRSPRPGEVEGRDRFFVTEDYMKEHLQEFLYIYRHKKGYLNGFSKKEILEYRNKGYDITVTISSLPTLEKMTSILPESLIALVYSEPNVILQRIEARGGSSENKATLKEITQTQQEFFRGVREMLEPIATIFNSFVPDYLGRHCDEEGYRSLETQVRMLCNTISNIGRI